MSAYPRALREKEDELLGFVLPADRPGYRKYRERIAAMKVLAEGARGCGNLILGYPGDAPDPVSALTPVVAYGALEATGETFWITVREEAGNQIDVEIVSSHQAEIPDHIEEKRRWTYSSWLPGQVSPATGAPVREVSVIPPVILAFAPEEKRIWVHDGRSGMVHLVPITNYYNELMLHKHVRDPKIALDSTLLFSRLASYMEEDLRSAFLVYNTLKRRVDIPPAGPAGHGSPLHSVFRRWSGR